MEHYDALHVKGTECEVNLYESEGGKLATSSGHKSKGLR